MRKHDSCCLRERKYSNLKRQNCIKTYKSNHYIDLYGVKLTRRKGDGRGKTPTSPPGQFTSAHHSPLPPLPPSPPTLNEPNTEGRARLSCLTNKSKPVAPRAQLYTQTQAYTQHVWFRGSHFGPSTPERKQPPRSVKTTNKPKMLSNATHVDSVCSIFVNKENYN